MRLLRFLPHRLLWTLPLVLVMGFSDKSPKGGNPFAQSQSEQKTGQAVRLVFSGNNFSQLGPCGCAIDPSGGVDRKLNFLDSIRDKGPFVLLDQGNLFFSATNLDDREFGAQKKQAPLLAEAQAELGVAVQNVGSHDLTAGLTFLRGLEKKYKLPLVSANLMDTQGTPLFSTHKVIESNGVKLWVTGVSGANSKALAKEGVLFTEPGAALIELVKKAPAEALVIVLSDLSAAERDRIRGSFSRPVFWFGSSDFNAPAHPLVDGNFVNAFVLSQGQELGTADILWRGADSKNWFNETRRVHYAKRWQQLLAEREELLKDKDSDSKKAELERNAESIKELGRMAPEKLNAPVSFWYYTQMLGERWKKKNRLTDLVKKAN